MLRTFSWGISAVVTAVLGLAAAVPACSSSTSGGGDAGPSGGDSGSEGGGDAGVMCPQPVGCPTPTPATTQLMTPVVSFKADVVPLFQMSCSLSSSCHSEMLGGPSLLYLGGPLTMPPDPAGIYKATINVNSLELPTMVYIKPGDVENSYLMHKMDGDLCQFTTCSQNPIPMCGVVMPMAGCALEATGGGPNPRDVVRRWIAQGAQNN
jgi:hypothetical protein